MRIRQVLVACAVSVVGVLAAGGQATAAPTTLDFTADTGGAKPNGFQSVDSDQVTFTDSIGASLNIADYGSQSHGQALTAPGDDASELVMDFAVPMQAVTLAFGNDDPGFSSATDRAALRVFEAGSEVGIATEAMNRNDLMDQTVSYTGPACFTQAKFRYETAAGAPINLQEIVDDIVFEPEPCAAGGGGDGSQGTSPPENCTDGIDNDGDSLIDGADTQSCPPGTTNPPNSTSPNLHPNLTSSLSSSVFQAAGSGPAFTAKVGTNVYFTVSEAGSVRFTVQRRLKTYGRRVRGKCVKATPSNRSNKVCVRWGKVKGAFTVPAKAGANKIKFRGRIGGKTLKPGRYRLNMQATDATGKKSKVSRRRFKIVK